jgi:signal transduction histidine kinase/ligand-binding sensor domain-containing protein
MYSKLCIAVFLIPLVGLAQQKVVSFNPVKSLSASSVDQWTSDNGLVSNNLTGILQSSDGFLWISTFNGLHRFDGHRFELYNRDNIPFLQADAFYGGHEVGGKLMLPTQTSGIVVHENNVFKPFLPGNKVLPHSVRDVLQATNGDLWIATNNQGLFVVRDTAVTKVEHTPVRDVSIYHLAQAKDGSIWAATNGNGVVKLSGDSYEHFTTQHGLSENIVNTLLCTAQGDVLVGTTRGLDIISGNTIKPVKLLQNIQVNALISDHYNSIWAATERGLARINFKLGLEEFFTKNDGLPTLSLTSLIFDREGNLWITTGKSGLIRLKDTGIVTYSETNGLSLDLTNIITEGPDGNIYIGSDGGNIDVMYEDGRIKPLKLTIDHQNIGIRDICFDRRGVLWIGSYNGLLMKDGSREILFNIKNGLPAQDVRRILEDSQGNLWLATRSGGAIVFSERKVKAVYSRETGIQSNYVMAIEEDPWGNIYLGTNAGGLSRVDPNGVITHYSITDNDIGLLIFNIHIDTQGMVWLVTNMGLFYFDGQKATRLQLADRTRKETHFDWVEDDAGNVWLSTNKGVIRMKKSDVLDFVRGNQNEIKTTLYDNSDGMKNRECTGATRSLKSSIGEIWVPTIGGASVIQPKNLAVNNVIPPVYITKLVTDEYVYYANDEIKIKSGNVRYAIQFTSLSLQAPVKNKFKYRLDGVDKNWIDGGTERETVYTGLKPGTYTFRVIASNNDEVWNTLGAKLTFTVQPFFYQTLLFRILLATSIVMAFFGIYKLRIHDMEKRNRELRKVNSELDRFVYSASHDLRAPLTSVLGLVNVAKADDGKEVKTYLNLIETSVKKLDAFIRDIIDFSRNARLEIKSEEIGFEPLIHEIMNDLKYLDEPNKILRTISITSKGSFYTDVRRLKIILSNLISNSIKYYDPEKESPFIEVKVEHTDQQAIIRVIDNGLGIAPEHQAHVFDMFYRGNESAKGSGLGLYIVKETVEKLNGKITVNSLLHNGSTFEVVLPTLQHQAVEEDEKVL